MQFYPHWLDGEFARLACDGHTPGQQSLTSNLPDVERLMKVHALLGTPFVLSDVQIVDSLPVQILFAKKSFVQFITRHPDFLDLRVQPDDSLGTGPCHLAARGLLRIDTTPKWRSSSWTDTGPIRALAAEIVAEVRRQDFTLERESRAIADAHRFGRDVVSRLKAVREAVDYFGRRDPAKAIHKPEAERSTEDPSLGGATPNRTPDPRTRWKTYYDVLTETRAHGGLPPDEEAGLVRTIKFIDEQFKGDEDSKGKRSCLLDVLHEAGEDRDVVWHNAVQAWNYATQLTLGPCGASAATLPFAVSPAPFLDPVADVMIPVRAERPTGARRSFFDCAQIPVELDALSWQHIADVWSHTTDERHAINSARSDALNPLFSSEERESARRDIGHSRVAQQAKAAEALPKVNQSTSWVVVATGATTVISLVAICSHMREVEIAGTIAPLLIALEQQRRSGRPERDRRALVGTLARSVGFQ